MSNPKELAKLTPPALAFLDQPLIGRLATTEGLQPHVVPVWYLWDGQGLWISSFRSTRKINHLRQNPRYSFVVDTDARGEDARGVLFEGQAQIIDDPALGPQRGFQIYARYLGEDGARKDEPQSWLHDPEHLLIYLDVEKIRVWGIS